VFFDFVTCPCSFRTKRHDNLFVYDDDDDEWLLLLYCLDAVMSTAVVQADDVFSW